MKLFEPITLGATTLNNRFIMAPLTRSRAGLEHMPNALMAEYYTQRASAGLIITECTMITENTSAFVAEPGIYSAAQVDAWKQVTASVHAAGGKIFMQIWHPGRAAHPANNNGAETVAPSAIAIAGEAHTLQGTLPQATPRALRTDEIPSLVAAFATAAQNALDAGFDGVEVHGANGYLVDQFLRSSSNQRTDAYGGSVENRARFLCEVLAAVSAVCGSDRVGLRLSPLVSYNSMHDSDPVGLSSYLADRLNAFNLAYLHVMRADFLGQQQGDVLTAFRSAYRGVLVANMGYSAAEAEQAIAAGQVDAVAFGTGFLANPDFPARVKAGAAMNAPRPEHFYSSGAEGYTDYPTLAASA